MSSMRGGYTRVNPNELLSMPGELLYTELGPELNYTQLGPEEAVQPTYDRVDGSDPTAAPLSYTVLGPEERSAAAAHRPLPPPAYDRVLPNLPPEASEAQPVARLAMPPPLQHVASPFWNEAAAAASPFWNEAAAASPAPAPAPAPAAATGPPPPVMPRTSFAAPATGVMSRSSFGVGAATEPPLLASSPPLSPRQSQAAIAAFSVDGVPPYYKDGIFDLTRFGWFHGRLSSKHANELLRDRPPGSFLVRLSTKGQGHFVLVHVPVKPKEGQVPGEPAHVLISPLVGAGATGYLVQGNPNVWSSIPQIVNAWASKRHLLIVVDSRNCARADPELRVWQMKALDE